MKRPLLVLGGIVLFAIGLLLHGGGFPTGVILVTTTSTQDSGLLDVLIPVFEEKSGHTVKTIAVGTGQALAMGARGEADVALVHVPKLEEKYVEKGAFIDRKLVMHNDFIIVGPSEDLAQIRGMHGAATAFGRIAGARAPFVSRGDNSGTHFLEQWLWQEAGIGPAGGWYIEAGQGMGATLMVASERRAYTLTDRGTYLAFQEKVGLEPLVQNDPILLNLYHVMAVNPTAFPRVNHAGARALIDFLVSAEAQGMIRVFGVNRFGKPLFFPGAELQK